MADLHEPSTVYQSPEWETPTTRPAKPSRIQRLFNSGKTTAPGVTTSNHHAEAAQPIVDANKETLPIAHTPASKPGFLSSAKARFDTAVPAQRTYFGRSRRSFLLYIVLPIAILLFLVLPLAIGLGVGLSHHSGGSQDLPLPVSSDVYTGDLTYYSPGLGACGSTSSSSDAICSVSHIIFDAASTGTNANENPLCGKQIRIQRDDVEGGTGNHSVDVTVVDRCTGCGASDLDLSLSVFEQLASQDSGRVTGSWAWLD
ncbi:RlpA-like double-psi beta-barrel-protein domain-containing protein-containing protein [Xylariaceae sp. FL0016]|nr:RlpA-like double-psi beta-barrel-protein domain-containing protein-containing protein [Xylariaceae sp. FL0016]